MSDNKIVMRSKALLSIVAFLAAFGISVAVTPRATKTTGITAIKRGCAQTEKAQKITNLLSQDIENGRERDRKIDAHAVVEWKRRANFVYFIDAVGEYADASASIDDSDLPHDFKTAWRAHMKAWEKHSGFLEEIRANPLNDGIGNGFSREEYSKQTKEISETWFEVLRIARQYDAYIPAGAY
jgi:hypothetical protein